MPPVTTFSYPRVASSAGRRRRSARVVAVPAAGAVTGRRRVLAAGDRGEVDAEGQAEKLGETYLTLVSLPPGRDA